MNRLILTAQLVERGALRYTPAGLPAMDLLLAHQGEMSEDGRPRKVALQIRAVAIGAITQAARLLALGTTAQYAGFLACTRNGRGLLFHITALEPTANELKS